MPSIPESALALGGRIGRYFSIVSMLPASLLVMWVYALIASGAWSGPPSLAALGRRIEVLSIADVVWLITGALALALFMHPFVYVTTQILEGYWGSSRIAIALAAARVIHHRRRRGRLIDRDESVQLDLDLRATTLLQPADREEYEEELYALLKHAEGERFVPHTLTVSEARRVAKVYPESHRILPTRLGNMLRSFEDSAGRQYGLRAIPTVPHFALVAPERHARYLTDSFEQLDLTIRLCTVSLLATAFSVALLVTNGLWLLLALVPYLLAYIAYRGAVAAGRQQGSAVRTIMDLDRLDLYKSLGLRRPRGTIQERHQNERLMALFGGDDSTVLWYAKEEEPPPPA